MKTYRVNNQDFRIDTLHKRGGKEVYMVSVFLNESGTLTQNLFPGKVFPEFEEAREAAMNELDLWLPFS